MVISGKFIAHWHHLRELYRHESSDSTDVEKRLVKMSMLLLDEVSVYPTVIERQRVQPCLNVFSDKTAIAIELYGETHGKDVSTVKFLVLVAKWFRVLNVKRKGINLRYNDAQQAVISSPSDERLNWIENFGIMCIAMA